MSGSAGIEVYDLLRDEYDIQIEFGDLGNILAYLSIGDRPRELERLVGALSEVRRRFGGDGTSLMKQEYIDPEVAVSPQDAFYAAKPIAAAARNDWACMQRICDVLSARNPDSCAR